MAAMVEFRVFSRDWAAHCRQHYRSKRFLKMIGPYMEPGFELVLPADEWAGSSLAARDKVLQFGREFRWRMPSTVRPGYTHAAAQLGRVFRLSEARYFMLVMGLAGQVHFDRRQIPPIAIKPAAIKTASPPAATRSVA